MKKNENITLEALKAELEIAESEQKGLSSKKKSLKRKIAEIEAAEAAASVEEAEVAEEAAAPVEEAEVAEEVTETPVEEAEVTEEVTETPVEEAEVTEEVTETPIEEAEVAKEVTETPVEEVEVTEEVTETPVEEAEVTEEVTDAPEQETPTQETAKDKNSVLLGILVGALAVCAIVICILAAVIAGRDQTNAPAGVPEDTDPGIEDTTTGIEDTTTGIEDTTTGIEDTTTGIEDATTGIEDTTTGIEDTTTGIEDTTTGIEDTTTGIEDTTTGIEDTTTGIEDATDPSGTDDPVTPEVPAFDVTQFVTSAVNISGQLTDDENIAANVNIFVENIGEDKLKELVEKHGELNVQKAIAEMLAFVPEIKMQQYVAKNGLDYNPNAVEDYDENLLAADEAYRAATNRNPDGALMSLEGYDTHKANREAIKALIIESGDTALLTWYEAKTDGFDLMKNQIRDTEAAEAYKEEVKLELANSKGTIKLLELQLEKEASGELTVMDNVSMQYTADYNQFILNNYMYVVAN